MKVQIKNTITLSEDQVKGARAYRDELGDDCSTREFIKDIVFNYGITAALDLFDRYYAYAHGDAETWEIYD